MSTGQGYIGGYIDPEVKARFIAHAEENGFTNTELLEDLLVRQLEKADDEVEEEALSLQEILESSLLWELNDHIINAAEETDEEDSQYLPQTLEILAARLHEHVNFEPMEEEDAVEIYYEDTLPEDLTEEINELLDRSIAALDGEFTREELFLAFAQELNKRADELFKESRAVQLNFSREEWYYLQKLLEEQNEEHDGQFSGLSNLIRYQLGDMLEDAGNGFFLPRDAEMMEVGERMKG